MPCWCGSGKKYKACHMAFDDRIAGFQRAGHLVPDHKIIKTEKDIEGIKKSAVINIAVLDEIGEKIKAGMSTQEIDDIVMTTTKKMGGIPADLGYEGFPKSVCTSINDEVCHGIPSKDIILKDGDIINVDCSTILNGYFSDSSRMFMIGDVSLEKKRLVQVTKECVEVGISKVIPWTLMGDMGHAVHQHALDNGYSVVREIGGHGCGNAFHEDPFVSYVSKPGTEMLMVPGMVFTIEPMVNMGTDRIYCDEENGWTIYTADHMPSAQWEVEVLVTETGCEILSW
ncbi:MAG TPA: methionine aminopeptidase [Lachnospiraceae bacterium]|nr:methionine aminopeptidase [Lachnospiraceae bacterium]